MILRRNNRILSSSVPQKLGRYVTTSVLTLSLNSGCAMLVMTGGQDMDRTNLNTSLSSAGVAEFGDNQSKSTNLPTVGIGIQGLASGIRMGAEGHQILPKSTSAVNGISTKFSGGYGLIHVGPTLLKTKNITILPSIGFGRGSLDLELERSTTVAAELPAGVGMTTTTTDSSAMRSKMSSDFYFTTAQIDIMMFPCANGLMWGLTGGYMKSPFGGDWRTSSGTRVSDLSPVSMTGPFIRLTVGFGDMCLDGKFKSAAASAGGNSGNSAR